MEVRAPSRGPKVRFPRTIWQTYKDPPSGTGAVSGVESWKRLNPDYGHQFLTDPEIDQFMAEHFDEGLVAVFREVPLGVMRADIWRYAVLYVHGGVYADIDTECRVPIDEWPVDDSELVVGLENNVHFCQWLIAATPGHPVLGDVLGLVEQRWRDGARLDNTDFVHYHTGPGVWTEAIGRYLGLRGQQAGRVYSLAKNRHPGICLLDEAAFNGTYVGHYYGSELWRRENGYVSWVDERNRIVKLHRSKPCRAVAWRLSRQGDGFRLKNQENRKILSCNASAACVLELCNGKLSINELAGTLAGMLDNPPLDLVDQVDQIVSEFEALGVLVGSEPRSRFTGTLRCLPPDSVFPLRLLEVIDIERSKRRYGNRHDGGYVLSEGFEYDLLVSCGIGDDTSFETAFLSRHPGVSCMAFDGTVASLPCDHPRIELRKQNVGAAGGREITDLRQEIGECRNIMLKMDIEGAEFSWLASLSRDDLARFRQIVMEIHEPFNPARWLGMEKLLETHYLVHVHGNNIADTRSVGDTGAQSRFIEIGASVENFKIVELDEALPESCELYLLATRFADELEVGIFPDRLALAVRRVDSPGGWGHNHWLQVRRGSQPQASPRFNIPDVLECTFVRKTDVPSRPRRSTSPIPGRHDAPNTGEREDISLNYYPFVDGGHQ